MHLKTIIVLLGIVSGVLYSDIFLYGSEVAIIAFLLGAIQLGLYCAQLYQKKSSAQNINIKNIPLLCGIFFLALSVGILRMQFATDKVAIICEHVCTFTGVVVSDAVAQDTYQVFSVRPLKSTTQAVYDVQVKAPLYPRVVSHAKVTLTGKVVPPFVGKKESESKVFDYSSYLLVHNIGSEMLYPKIQIDSVKVEESFIQQLESLKEIFVLRIHAYVTAPASALASGMLFGDSSMSKELKQTFRVAGLSHIVVLSGFNIAILISFVLFVLMFLPLVIRVLTAGIFVVLFVIAVGAEASIVRATLMSFIALAALTLGRGYTARQALLLSLLIIILYKPEHLLFDVSLHLSFLATAGIVYAGDGIKKLFQRVNSSLYREILATTFAAYVATLPYVMYTFSTASPYALLTNAIVLPLVPGMMLVTFLIIVLAPISPHLGMLFGYLDTLLGNGIIFVARTIEKLPFSSFQISFSFIMMCTMYFCMMILYVFMMSLKKSETIQTNNEEIISDVISY